MKHSVYVSLMNKNLDEQTSTLIMLLKFCRSADIVFPIHRHSASLLEQILVSSINPSISVCEWSTVSALAISALINQHPDSSQATPCDIQGHFSCSLKRKHWRRKGGGRLPGTDGQTASICHDGADTVSDGCLFNSVRQWSLN